MSSKCCVDVALDKGMADVNPAAGWVEWVPTASVRRGTSVIPAKAGIQGPGMGSGLRRNDEAIKERTVLYFG